MTPSNASATARTAAERWLAGFAAALARGDAAALAALFRADGHWRDVVAFTWHIRTFIGPKAVARALVDLSETIRPAGFALDPERTPPRIVRRAGIEAIEAFFRFETAAGRGSGVLRLIPEDGRAWTFHTALQALKGFEERIGARRPKGEADSRDFSGDNWLDRRIATQAFADRDPEVIVVGGGQAGLATAARLGQLGLDTLVVDRAARIGDNWRKRYHALTLHNEVTVNHLPYMPFPETWPVYVPKDKLAGWFEAYAEAMELNVWTGTEFCGGDWDAAAERWSVTLRRADGGERTMRPRHVVMATGVSGIPHIPEIPGLGDFAGTVLHSGDFTDGSPWRGKRAIVIGTGNSGHDVAQDLHSRGAEVAIVQRSPTTVVSIEPSGQMVYATYKEGPPVEDCDLITTSVAYPVLVRGFKMLAQAMLKEDRALLDALHRVGFRMDIGEDETGFQMKYLRRGGGYYLNVGCAELIAERKVRLVQRDTVDRFAADGLRLADGTVLPADLLVLATGYKGQQDLVRRLFGEPIADRVGPVWGFDETEGELRAMFRRTGQPGLWFIAGSLAQCRIYSQYLALQIRAIEAGLMPMALPAAWNATRIAAE